MFKILIMGSLIGCGATVLLDLWAQVQSRLLGTPRPNWGPAGRWFALMPQGRFAHAGGMGDVPSVPNEAAIGWFMHYLIGALYGVALVILAGGIPWLESPTLLPALLVGWVTVLAAWLCMQPAMGSGYFASKTPNPPKTMFLNVIGHTVFGLGLYLSALLLRSFA